MSRVSSQTETVPEDAEVSQALIGALANGDVEPGDIEVVRLASGRSVIGLRTAAGPSNGEDDGTSAAVAAVETKSTASGKSLKLITPRRSGGKIPDLPKPII